MGIFAGFAMAVFLAVTLGTPSDVAALEIVVPAYFYPSTSGSDWDHLDTAVGEVPITAIMNPASGPGTFQNSDYTSAVGSFRGVGGRVIGYVSSSYATRPLNDVLADIDKYAAWYTIDGIFVDEMTNGSSSANLDFYESVYDHVKSIDPNWEVMGNPGTNTQEAYLTRPTADRLMVFESFGADYPGHVPSSWNASYDSSKFVNLLHTLNPNDVSTMEQYVDLAVSRNVGGVYFTDDVLNNPWDRLPAFWEEQVAKVKAINDFVPGALETLSNPVVNGGISIDALRADWSDVTPYMDDVDLTPSPGPELDYQRVTIANDANQLFFRFEMDDSQTGAPPTLGTRHNIYLDVDQDRSTGFIGAGGFLSMGADYLIQGGRLFAFSGATQEIFTWSFLEDLATNDSPTNDVELALSRASINNPAQFDFLINAANSSVEDYLPNAANGGVNGQFYRYELGTASLTGDYNSDGVVDAADYVQWRNTTDQTVPVGEGADGNKNGVIDPDDYLVWRQHFGQTSSSSALSAELVPEPTTFCLLISMLTGTLGVRPAACVPLSSKS